jgi:hypothetical protein
VKGFVGAGLIAVLLSIAAAPAAAAVRTGSGTDPAGDGTAGPARDVTGVQASYDDATGAIAFQVTFAAAPSAGADSFVTGLLGTRQSDGSCSYPAGGVGGNASGGVVVWLRDDDGSQTGPSGSDGSRSLSGATLNLGATASPLAGRSWDCAIVTLSQPGNSAVVYDRAGPFDIAAAPSPPAQPTPAPTPAPAPKPQPKRAQLAVSVSGIPTTIRRNRWMRLKVAVANPGSAAARKVRLAIASARGLSARPRARTFKLIRAGKRSSATIRVKLTRRARTTTKVGVRATAGKLTARQTLALRIGAPPKSPPKGKGGLAGRYFWRTVTRVDYAWDNRGIAFVDDRWAYRGIPKGGLPTCSRVTAGVDAKGEPTDGCLRYTYDKATGTVTVGGEQGRFDKATGKLTIGSDDYDPLAIPAPGMRLDVSLVNRGFSGFCGLIVGCTTWTDYLTLRTDGQFALSSQSLSSMGGSGAPFTYAWSAPPDQHGTYEVQSGGRVRLAFANGSVSVRTIGIGIGAGGRPDAAGTGLLLDDVNFYKDDG